MWFTIAIIAFGLLGLAAVIDKFMLSKTPVVPSSFSFYIALMGAIFSPIIIFFSGPFGWPTGFWPVIIFGGAALYFGLYFMFSAVAGAEVSKANALIVSITPLTVFLVSLMVGLDTPSWHKIVGGAIIIISSYLLAQVGVVKHRLKLKQWIKVILSSLMFGLAYFFSKVAYDHLAFATAFVWMRWVTFATAVVYLGLLGRFSDVIIKTKSHKSHLSASKTLGIFIGGQACGSLAVILEQYAIKLGPVVLVTALNGSQFFFVIIFVFILSKFFPKILHEDLNKKYFLAKVAYSILLFLGMFLVII